MHIEITTTYTRRRFLSVTAKRAPKVNNHQNHQNTTFRNTRFSTENYPIDVKNGSKDTQDQGQQATRTSHRSKRARRWEARVCRLCCRHIACPGGLRLSLPRWCRWKRICSVDVKSWRSIPRFGAAVILVTPESAVSKGFSTFINRLQGTYKLDRVICDEAYCVLDSGPEFRPKIRKLSRIWSGGAPQLVYLTATLPPPPPGGRSRVFQGDADPSGRGSHVPSTNNP
jgi:hypothetical protein